MEENNKDEFTEKWNSVYGSLPPECQEKLEPITELFKDTLKKVEKDRDEYLGGWKRAKADLINYKKEEAERMQYLARKSNETLLGDLIMILDSFELGLSAMDEHDASKKGMALIRNQLYDTMKKYGVEIVKIREGDPYDPEFAEAVGTIESGQSPGTIAEEVTKGYTLYGKTLRPARVIITKEKSEK